MVGAGVRQTRAMALDEMIVRVLSALRSSGAAC
jgi:hypothetical protein